MPERDEKGLFLPGNQVGKAGRPMASGKQYVKDLVWEEINRIVDMIFRMPERELNEYLKANKDVLQLSRAERLYLERSTELGVIEALLDRVIGKTLAIDNASNRDPIIERLYQLGPGGVKKEIDELIEARNTINAEFERISEGKETP